MLKKLKEFLFGQSQPTWWEEPRPKQIWRINDGDPFPPKSTVEILETCRGWVRFQIGNGSLYYDERMPIEKFMRTYRFYTWKMEDVK